MNKYVSRVTKSARGEVFNPLLWPFLLTTFAYGVGFAAFFNTAGVMASSLYTAMAEIYEPLPIIWGSISLTTIVLGFTFILFNIPPFGKISGLVGFMLWTFAATCYGLEGGYLPMLAFAVPNMWFWFWQYISLSHFRREDAEDKETLRQLRNGEL